MKILHNGFRFSIIFGRWVTKLPYSDAGISHSALFYALYQRRNARPESVIMLSVPNVTISFSIPYSAISSEGRGIVDV